MDTDNFIAHVKADEIYNKIAGDLETRFDTLNFELDRPLPQGKNKKVIGLMKDELVRKIIKEFVGLRAKTYSYLKENNHEGKQGTRKCVIKRKLKFQDHKNCLEAGQVENKIKYLEKNEIDVDCLKKDKKKKIS